ncbi:MAG: hypothetical protein RLZZ244_1348 [Verrucomicrobiota bacterium]
MVSSALGLLQNRSKRVGAACAAFVTPVPSKSLPPDASTPPSVEGALRMKTTLSPCLGCPCFTSAIKKGRL